MPRQLFDMPCVLSAQRFCNLDFKVREGVLVPRRSSEIIVDAAYSAVVDRPSDIAHGGMAGEGDIVHGACACTSGRHTGRGAVVLDIGTGSGCLLLSLLHRLPEAVGIGQPPSPSQIHSGSGATAT